MRKNLSSTLLRTALTVAMSAALAVTLPAELFGQIGGALAADEWICTESECNGTEHDHPVTVGSNREISGGTFKQKVTVDSGIISNGIFEGDVEVSGDGMISGGTFKGKVEIDDATISEGTFHGDVTVDYKIEGGTFYGNVYTNNSARISGGNFYGTVYNNGTISGGHYVSSNSITGGGSVENVTYDLGSSSGGTGSSTTDPDPSPSAGKSDTSFPAPHTHSYAWETVQEVNAEQDGIDEYKCSCGDVQERCVLPRYMAIVKGLYGAVKDAPQNGTATFDTGSAFTMTDYVIRKLSERTDVTTVVTFKYQNQSYRMTIPAGADYTELLSDGDYFYGYFYFANAVGATIEAVV